jgi:hypothetical protein
MSSIKEAIRKVLVSNFDPNRIKGSDLDKIDKNIRNRIKTLKETVLAVEKNYIDYQEAYYDYLFPVSDNPSSPADLDVPYVTEKEVQKRFMALTVSLISLESLTKQITNADTIADLVFRD